MLETKSQDMAQNRRLTTVLAADVCGYSRLAERDEAAAIKTVQIVAALFEKTVTQFRGRVFSQAGDGFLAEFPSVADGVNAAMAFLDDIRSRDTVSPNALQAKVRAGLHVGDVVEQPNGDLLGHGVNIAARLQGEATPNNVLVSLHAVNLVRDKVDYSFNRRGTMALKNIDEPVVAFDVLVSTKKYSPLRRPLIILQPEKLHLILATISFFLVVYFFTIGNFVIPIKKNAPQEEIDGSSGNLVQTASGSRVHSKSPLLLAVNDAEKSLLRESDPDKVHVAELLRRGEIQSATSMLNTIIKEQRDRHVDQEHIVSSLKQLGAIKILQDGPAALEAYEAAYNLDPDDPIILYQLATINVWNQEYSKARAYFLRLQEKANSLSTEEAGNFFKFRAELGLISVNTALGSLEGAEEKLKAHLKFARDNTLLFEEADALRLLGNLKSDQKNAWRAKNYYEASLVIERSLDDKRRLAKTLVTYGSFLHGWTDRITPHFEEEITLKESSQFLQKAISALQEAIVHSEQVGDSFLKATSASNLSEIHHQMNTPEIALQYSDIALEIARRQQRIPMQSYLLLKRSEILSAQNNIKEACGALYKSKELNQVLENPNTFINDGTDAYHITLGCPQPI